MVFKNIINRTKAGMANKSNSPEAVFADSVNLVLGNYLIYALQNDEPATGMFHLNELLKQVTPATVQQTAQQYINDKNYLKLVLMPEAAN